MSPNRFLSVTMSAHCLEAGAKSKLFLTLIVSVTAFFLLPSPGFCDPVPARNYPGPFVLVPASTVTRPTPPPSSASQFCDTPISSEEASTLLNRYQEYAVPRGQDRNQFLSLLRRSCLAMLPQVQSFQEAKDLFFRRTVDCSTQLSRRLQSAFEQPEGLFCGNSASELYRTRTEALFEACILQTPDVAYARIEADLGRCLPAMSRLAQTTATQMISELHPPGNVWPKGELGRQCMFNGYETGFMSIIEDCTSNGAASLNPAGELVPALSARLAAVVQTKIRNRHNELTAQQMLASTGSTASAMASSSALNPYGGRSLYACVNANENNITYSFPTNQTQANNAFSLRVPTMVCPTTHSLQKVSIPRHGAWGGFGMGGGAWVYSSNQDGASPSVGLTSTLHFFQFGIDLDQTGRRRGEIEDPARQPSYSDSSAVFGMVEGNLQYNVAALRTNPGASSDSAFVTSISARLQTFVGVHRLRPGNNVGFYTGVSATGNMGTALNSLGYPHIEGRIGPESGLIFRTGDGDFIMVSPSAGIRGTNRLIGDGTGRNVTTGDVDLAAIVRASFGQRLLLQAVAGSSAYRISGSHTGTYLQSAGTLRLNSDMRLVAVVNYNYNRNPAPGAEVRNDLSTVEATLTWVQDF